MGEGWKKRTTNPCNDRNMCGDLSKCLKSLSALPQKLSCLNSPEWGVPGVGGASKLLLVKLGIHDFMEAFLEDLHGTTLVRLHLLGHSLWLGLGHQRFRQLQ